MSTTITDDQKAALNNFALSQPALKTPLLGNPLLGDTIQDLQNNLNSGLFKVSLVAAAEAGNAIVVTGQIKDYAGNNVAAATQVRITTRAPTTAKGVITTVSGTEETNQAVTGFVHEVDLVTTAAGAFSVSVADDQVESVYIEAMANGCVPAMLKLTFA